ncbi:MAG: amidohydrolase family protein [Candidatus Riflebacteria bacterium]|nr:amidohydrolase family protein [Candidatus Riflebacteria bacterium]
MMKPSILSSKFPPDFLSSNSYRDLSLPKHDEALVYHGYRLSGLIDMHLHGAFGWDFSFGNPDRIDAMLDGLLETGLSGVVATIITCSEEQRMRALADIRAASSRRNRPPRILGISLEGPFLAPARRGSHPESELMLPDPVALERWQNASGGMIRLVTVAPELPGAEALTRFARNLDIRVAIGHTDADHKTTRTALAAGADHVTHMYNAMRPFSHRDPTAVSAVLGNRSTTVELIGDGIHVVPEIVALTHSIVGPERIAFISDGVCPMGLPDGVHVAYGQHLELYKGRCTIKGGHLFGGGKCLLEAFAGLHRDAGIPLDAIAASTSSVPARIIGVRLPNADIIVDEAFNWLATRIDDLWYWRDRNGTDGE